MRELIGIHLNSELWALLIRLLHDRVLCHKETRLIFRKRGPATLAKILAVHKVDLSLLRKVNPWGCLTSFFPLPWQTHLLRSIHAAAYILKRASLVGLTMFLEAQLVIHKLLHARSAQSFVPERGVFLTLLSFLKYNLI